MILVTGAAGKTGRAVIRALAARSVPVRALVFRPEQVAPVQELGAQEAVVGDMRVQSVVDQAVHGARAVYHICPNMSPDELAIGQTVIGAARSAAVECFVYHSVLHPQTESMPHHWEKLRVEEQLLESGLPFTILQPAAYMQNLLGHWDDIVERGVYAVPYAVETRIGMVDLEDVAEAAAIVLTEPGHIGATYELAGAEMLTQTEVAAILTQQLGHLVRAMSVPRQVWEQQARASGLPGDRVDLLLRMFRYYEQVGFWGNPRVLSWLLGRPPTPLAAFVDRTVEQQRQTGAVLLSPTA